MRNEKNKEKEREERISEREKGVQKRMREEEVEMLRFSCHSIKLSAFLPQPSHFSYLENAYSVKHAIEIRILQET